MTNEIADLDGTVGDLTAKMWDELATCGDDVVAVEWVDGSPMGETVVPSAYTRDVFSREWPGSGRACTTGFQSLQDTAECLATL